MSNIQDLNLGKPIGGATQPHPTTGEHGTGAGVSGGHSHAHAANSQSGGQYTGQSGFNAGLGGDHASAGIPKDGSHPIADKFMGQSGEQDTVSGTYGGGSTGDALTGQSHAHTTGHGHASGLGAGAVGAGLGAGAGAGAIGGQYTGSGTNDGLTGQSNASTTGAGVGPLGENTGDKARAAAFGTTAGGAAAAAGTGVGPSGGSGGHYSSDSAQTGSGRHEQPATTSNLVKEGEATGRFGHADQDESRGQPISDPKSLDSGGPHGLVFQESTGKYVHRHELEGQK